MTEPRTITAPPPLDFEGLLTFERKAPNVLEAYSQRPFKPRGLLLWDVGAAQIQMCTIGANHELVSSFAPIPARFFTTAASFEQVALAVAEGKEPPAWGSWSQVHVGQIVRLVFDSAPPGVQAVMWGHAIRY